MKTKKSCGCVSFQMMGTPFTIKCPQHQDILGTDYKLIKKFVEVKGRVGDNEELQLKEFTAEELKQLEGILKGYPVKQIKKAMRKARREISSFP